MVMGGPTRKQIVICDDHPVFRRGLAAALAEEEDLALAGQAGSLSELQRLLGSLEGSVDLILLDVELPEGSAIAGVAELPPRQRDVLELVAEGCSNREIAGRLHLSDGTVKNHVSNLLEATGMPDRTKLAVAYVQHCLNTRSGGAGSGFSPR